MENIKNNLKIGLDLVDNNKVYNYQDFELLTFKYYNYVSIDKQQTNLPSDNNKSNDTTF